MTLPTLRVGDGDGCEVDSRPLDHLSREATAFSDSQLCVEVSRYREARFEVIWWVPFADATGRRHICELTGARRHSQENMGDAAGFRFFICPFQEGRSIVRLLGAGSTSWSSGCDAVQRSQVEAQMSQVPFYVWGLVEQCDQIVQLAGIKWIGRWNARLLVRVLDPLTVEDANHFVDRRAVRHA